MSRSSFSPDMCPGSLRQRSVAFRLHAMGVTLRAYPLATQRKPLRRSDLVPGNPPRRTLKN